MTALAPTLQAFFTDRLIGRRTPARTPSPPTATRCGCCSASPRSRTGTPPARLRLDGPRRAADRRVPRPPRTRARQQRAHPQRPPGRDPLAVPLRRAAPPRTRRTDRPGAGDPTQTLRPTLSSPTSPTPKSTRCSPRPTPADLDRSTRPRAAAARRPDRAARLRADRADLRATSTSGTGAHVRCHGKGRKHRITPLDRQTVAVLRDLARRTRGRPQRSAVPDQPRRPLSRDAVARLLTNHATTARNAAPRSTQRRSPRTCCATPPPCDCCTPASTPPSSRSGSATRRHRHHPDLPARRPRPQRTRPRPHHTPPTRRPGDTSPPTRCSPSSRHSDYAEAWHTDPLPRRRFSDHLGIIRRSA